MAAPPLLWLLIGPNGAGKTTYYDVRIRPRVGIEFVNADRIAADRWAGEGPARAYEAAKLAEARRRDLLARRQSMVAETVFSHPSKLDLIRDCRASGYQVWVTFIYLGSRDLAVARVAERVARGGHDVPANKVRERYDRMAALAVEAVLEADRAFVVDNSSVEQPLRDVVVLQRGRVTWRAAALPDWVERLFHQTWRS